MIKQFEKRLPEMLQLLQQIVELESPSSDKDAVDKLVEFLASVAGKIGGSPTLIPQQERGNHLRLEWGQGEEQLLILCHIDTVYKRGEIKKRPFSIVGDKVMGPGVYDMKGGVVQTYFALEYLVQADWPLNSRVVVLLTSDEEIGSVTSRTLIETETQQSKAVFVLEPAAPPYGALKTSRKGVGEFILTIKGIASHAGSAPQEGASAVVELAHQILYLQSLNDYEIGSTVNVGIVEGGSASNVVASDAKAEIDLRVVSKEEGDKLVPLIMGLRPRIEGTEIRVTGGLERPPMERTKQVEGLFNLAQKLALELGFEITESGSGGGSDGNFTAGLGIPTLDGLGPVGDGAHAAHEYLLASKLPERTALLVRLLQEVGKAST